MTTSDYLTIQTGRLVWLIHRETSVLSGGGFSANKLKLTLKNVISLNPGSLKITLMRSLAWLPSASLRIRSHSTVDYKNRIASAE